MQTSMNDRQGTAKLFEMLEGMKNNMEDMKKNMEDMKKNMEDMKNNVVTKDDLANVREIVVTTKADVVALKNDMNVVRTDLATVTRLQGYMCEEALRSRVAKEFGTHFAKSFNVSGLLGLTRLVTQKSRDELDVENQRVAERTILNAMFKEKTKYCTDLIELAEKQNNDRKDSLINFASNAVTLVADEFIKLCTDQQNRGLALALFCAAYVKTRTIERMQFDCRGDIQFGQPIILRTLEFKRKEHNDALFQVFEHLGACIAVARILYQGQDVHGKAMVVILDSPNHATISEKPNRLISIFDNQIQLVKPVFK